MNWSVKRPHVLTSFFSSANSDVDDDAQVQLGLERVGGDPGVPDERLRSGRLHHRGRGVPQASQVRNFFYKGLECTCHISCHHPDELILLRSRVKQIYNQPMHLSPELTAARTYFNGDSSDKSSCWYRVFQTFNLLAQIFFAYVDFLSFCHPSNRDSNVDVLNAWYQ